MRPRLKTRKTAAAAVLFFFAFGTIGAHAQTPSPTPTEEELRLQEEKRLLELRRDIEQAKKAIRDAQPKEEVPAPSATPLAGETTLENVKLESEMVAYKAMSSAADIISGEVKRRIGQPAKTLPALAIYDAQVVKDWRFYQALFPAFDGQVKDILNRYTKLLCPREDVSPEFKSKFCGVGNRPLTFEADKRLSTQLIPAAIPGAFAAGTNLIKSFVDLTALFRTDTKITGNAFTIEESALVAEVFRALRNKYSITGPGINLYYPEVFPPRLRVATNGDPKDQYSTTVTTIGALFLAKIEADRVIETLNQEKQQLTEQIAGPTDEIRKLQEQLDRVETLTAELDNLRRAFEAEDDPVIKKRIEKERADVSAALAKLSPAAVLKGLIDIQKESIKDQTARIKEINGQVKAMNELNKRFQTFVDEFVKVDAAGTNALALFIRAEDIENVLKDDNHSYWLEIKSVTAGGNNRVRKNLIRYFTGPRLDHSGGVIIEYTLYNKEGAVVYSDKLSVYEGYIEPRKIKDKANFKDAVTP